MNLKFWGGWFLAIACVCIFLTMGCEKGSLGVKYSTVCGRLVNKDNISLGVPNATVRMVSKEAVSGGGTLSQGYNFLATVTDADGYFIFEKVQPDNVIFEFSAPGYRKSVFPSDQSSTESDGSTSESADIESVTISNGAVVDLANILMEKVSEVIPSKIGVKIEFIDAITKKRVSDDESFSVSFDGVEYPAKKAIAWRTNGVDDVMGASQISVNVRYDDEPVLYYPVTKTINGTSNQYVTIELTPVTYSLTFQFIGVPSYILSSTNNKPILSLLVEDASSLPVESIDIVDVNNLNQQTHLDISAVRNPQFVRIRMNGYRDEVIKLTDNLLQGAKGSYRIDVDFQSKNDNRGTIDNIDYPVTVDNWNGRVGMLDNAITQTIKVNMIGLTPNTDKVSIITNFDPTITYTPTYDSTKGLADENGAVTAILRNSPSYFDMSYTISVFPSNPASSSYIITSGSKSVPIGIPEKLLGDEFGTVSEGTEITIDVSKIDASSTSTTE